MDDILTKVRKALKENVDEKTLNSGQRYFKETVTTYGVRIPVVNEISKSTFESINAGPKAEIYALCDSLWQSGYLEETIIACNWSYSLRERYQPDDFSVFDKWVNCYVDNWTACDTLCNHSVGAFIEMYPHYLSELKVWARSPNRWARRASAVTLIIPARKGLFLSDIFELAELLLTDKDDLVRKGYGWMLKAASEAHRQAVFDFVTANKAVMPRTALRYAIEKMPPDLKAQAMVK